MSNDLYTKMTDFLASRGAKHEYSWAKDKVSFFKVRNEIFTLMAETDNSVSRSANETDVTNKSSGEFGDTRVTSKSGTASISANVVIGDTGYETLEEVYESGEVFEYYRVNLVTKKFVKYDAIITNLDEASPTEGVETASISLKFNGKPVKGTASAGQPNNED